MARKNYIPNSDSLFLEWAKTMTAYAAEKRATWQIGAPSEAMLALLADFEVKLKKAINPNRGKIDVVEKNEARKALEKNCRTYVQGFLAKNPYVTTADREKMGITVYDTTPTPVGDPVGLVSATVKYPNEGALELYIAHVEGSPYDRRANYGVKIAYDVFHLDAPPMEDVSLLHRAIFTRRKRELLTFDKRDSRKTVFFCLRYENSKGKAGQWGPIISAVIP